jgi:hypothetical protein
MSCPWVMLILVAVLAIMIISDTVIQKTCILVIIIIREYDVLFIKLGLVVCGRYRSGIRVQGTPLCRTSGSLGVSANQTTSIHAQSIGLITTL